MSWILFNNDQVDQNVALSWKSVNSQGQKQSFPLERAFDLQKPVPSLISGRLITFSLWREPGALEGQTDATRTFQTLESRRGGVLRSATWKISILHALYRLTFLKRLKQRTLILSLSPRLLQVLLSSDVFWWTLSVRNSYSALKSLLVLFESVCDMNIYMGKKSVF